LFQNELPLRFTFAYTPFTGRWKAQKRKIEPRFRKDPMFLKRKI